MKREEIIQRAKEYICKQLVNLEDFDSYETAYRRYENDVEDAYIDGAIENGIHWHNLCENSNDLPPRDKKDYHHSIEVLTNIGRVALYSYEFKWWVPPDDLFHPLEDICAWCEFPSFGVEND